MFMRYISLFLILLSLLSGRLNVFGQEPIGTPISGPLIRVPDIKQAMIAATVEFKGEDIFKYWGDCPELLIEYGFKRMIFEDIFVNRNLYHMEISEMRDSAAAFGAYSVTHRETGEKDSLFEYSFHNDRELLLAKGSWFIRVHTLKLDSINGRKTLIAIAQAILPRIPGNVYSPPGLLTARQLRQFRPDLKLIKGYLGLYYGFPDWVSLFSGIKFTELAILPVPQTTGQLNFARIVFNDGSELEKFQHNNSFYDTGNPKYKKNEKDKTKWIFLRTGENTAVLMEGKGDSPFINALMGQIESIGTRK